MAVIKGTISAFHPVNGKRDDAPKPGELHNLSIEGISFLVPGNLVEDCISAVKTGEVQAVVSVQWKPNKRPNHWLKAIVGTGLGSNGNSH